MLRRWLMGLLHRPRAFEAAEPEDVQLVEKERSVRSERNTFQPIRSQEEIAEEELADRAPYRTGRVISKLMSSPAASPSGRVKSRPSPLADEAP